MIISKGLRSGCEPYEWVDHDCEPGELHAAHYLQHRERCITELSVIGKNGMVGAGSVVTKDVPSESIVCGIPARMLKRDFSTDR